MARDVAFAEQAHDSAGAKALGQQTERWLLAAGERKDLESQRLPVVDEPTEQRFRFESFGDGGKTPAVLHQPDACHVPVARVRQRQHHTLAAVEGRIESCLIRGWDDDGLGGGRQILRGQTKGSYQYRA